MAEEIINPGAKTRVALLSVVSNTVLVLLKLAAAFWTGSISIFSEALHSGMDLVAALMAFFSVRASGKPADSSHPFGHAKFESVSGAAEGILIIAAAALIVHSAARRMLLGSHELEMPLAGAAVMAVSVVVNIIVSRRLMKTARQTESIALEADAWHLRTDVYTSAGVFVGMALVALGMKMGWHWALHIDPILAMLIALVILKAGWEITTRSCQHLVDRSIPAEEREQLVALLERHYARYVDFHSLRTRQAGHERHIDFHLTLPPEMTLEEAHDLCDHLERDIQALLPRSMVLIHTEPACKDQSSETQPDS